MFKYWTFLQIITYVVADLSCERCASDDPNSDCRNGTIKEKFKCPADEQACYAEDIINDGKTPLYRRGCAPEDWCDTQKKNHAAALKFCSVCTDGDMCNNKRFGAEDPAKIQCYKCDSEDTDSTCRTGSIDNESVSCRSGSSCYQYYVSTSRRDIYSRGCGTSSTCDDLGKQYGQSLESCKLCDDDYCNNEKMSIAV
ncbi:hypothetical protein WA026_001801 [Henosepilachna vigintioctopunctata]|uniref:UPAR/Ly6 domain-containing protein n=1 Tax=Henosepilachna vigintioctopunctata TaxID=420089 RepID=A0AAW1UM85_9CUCU